MVLALQTKRQRITNLRGKCKLIYVNKIFCENAFKLKQKNVKNLHKFKYITLFWRDLLSGQGTFDKIC
jgi:hypothetical protein